MLSENCLSLVKLRFLQSIAIAGLLGCCSGSRELTTIGAAPAGRADGAKVVTELHAKEKGRETKAGAELEKHL
jgi:hypothetical protein